MSFCLSVRQNSLLKNQAADPQHDMRKTQIRIKDPKLFVVVAMSLLSLLGEKIVDLGNE